MYLFRIYPIRLFDDYWNKCYRFLTLTIFTIQIWIEKSLQKQTKKSSLIKKFKKKFNLKFNICK